MQMGSFPYKSQNYQNSNHNTLEIPSNFKLPPKAHSVSEESKSLPLLDARKLEIGEYFLEKYLTIKKKKQQMNIKQWDSLLKKIQKSKGLFNSIELPLPSNTINQGSSSPSNSCSSLTFDSTLIHLFYTSNRAKFLYRNNHSPGPPMKYRYICWKAMLNIPNGFDPQYHLYKNKKTDKDVDRDIKKDLHRTYPTQKLFTYRENEDLSIGEKQLYNVLKAIANNFPRIGYCQGMNFVVGFLLLISGGNENDAFILFQKLGLDMRFHILGLFENNFPLVNFYVFIFWKLMKEKNENLKVHLEKLGVPDHAWISKWFMMLFLYSLPLDVICRVWDFIFSEESLLSAVKIALALMKILKPDLLKFEEIYEIMEYFKILKGGLYEPYQSVFIVDQAAKSQRISLKGDILVRKARKIKLNRKTVAEAAREFLKINPQFNNHVLMQYYCRFDVMDIKEIKAFEGKMNNYYSQEDEKIIVNKDIRKMSFDNFPILSDNDEFLGANEMKKIPVFDINTLVIFNKIMKKKKEGKKEESEEGDEENKSEESLPQALKKDFKK